MLFLQTTDGENIPVPAGVHTGYVALTKTNCVFEGVGPESVIRASGAGEVIRGTSVGICNYTLKNLTIDCDNLPTVIAAISVDPGQEVYLENVIITGHVGSMAVLNRCKLYVKNLTITGDGGGVYHYTGAQVSYIDGLEVRGGKYAFLANAPGVIHLSRIKGRLNYWAVPSCEAVTATGFGEDYVDVVSHVEAHRNLYDCVRALTPVGSFSTLGRLYCPAAVKWDRVETSTGHWTEVLSVEDGMLMLDEWHLPGSWVPCDNPGGVATVYRVALGRLYAFTPTRLSFSTSGADGHWRTIEGEVAELPDTTRVDIVRHGYTGGIPRDVDSGGIHITDTSSAVVITDCKIFGTFSDGITPRVSGSRLYNCHVSYGQDMGFTLHGKHFLYNCFANKNGYNGYYLFEGASELYNCVANSNGTHNDGSGGYGVVVSDTASTACKLHVVGQDNLEATVGGTRTSGDEYPYKG
jgi:hypothetical protein